MGEEGSSCRQSPISVDAENRGVTQCDHDQKVRGYELRMGPVSSDLRALPLNDGIGSGFFSLILARRCHLK